MNILVYSKDVSVKIILGLLELRVDEFMTFSVYEYTHVNTKAYWELKDIEQFFVSHGKLTGHNVVLIIRNHIMHRNVELMKKNSIDGMLFIYEDDNRFFVIAPHKVMFLGGFIEMEFDYNRCCWEVDKNRADREGVEQIFECGVCKKINLSEIHVWNEDNMYRSKNADELITAWHKILVLDRLDNGRGRSLYLLY